MKLIYRFTCTRGGVPSTYNTALTISSGSKIGKPSKPSGMDAVLTNPGLTLCKKKAKSI